LAELSRLLQKYRLLVAVIGVLTVVALVFAILVIPPLLRPPQETGPGYDVFAAELASSTVEPDQDQLVGLPHLGIAAFIPGGAFGGGGQVILKERRADLVPIQQDAGYVRGPAVDLIFITSGGEVLESVVLMQPVLLCFHLAPDQWAAQQTDPGTYRVEAFDESMTPPEWHPLTPAPGWDPEQVCGLVEHLSLFGLSRNMGAAELEESKAAPTPLPAITVIPPELYSPAELP